MDTTSKKLHRDESTMNLLQEQKSKIASLKSRSRNHQKSQGVNNGILNNLNVILDNDINNPNVKQQEIRSISPDTSRNKEEILIEENDEEESLIKTDGEKENSENNNQLQEHSLYTIKEENDDSITSNEGDKKIIDTNVRQEKVDIEEDKKILETYKKPITRQETMKETNLIKWRNSNIDDVKKLSTILLQNNKETQKNKNPQQERTLTRQTNIIKSSSQVLQKLKSKDVKINEHTGITEGTEKTKSELIIKTIFKRDNFFKKNNNIAPKLTSKKTKKHISRKHNL